SVLDRAQAGHEVARAELAREANARPGVVGPALGDRLAREVNHCVGAGERLDRSRLASRIGPAMSVPARRRPLGAPPVAAQPRRLVASREELAYERAADQSSGAGDDYTHGAGYAPTCAPSVRAAPLRSASRATALATQELT